MNEGQEGGWLYEVCLWTQAMEKTAAEKWNSRELLLL